MPNVMAALPNIGGALCSSPQSLAWLTPTARVPCSNAAKTRNPLTLGRVPQITEPISAVGGHKFTILWGRVEEILLLNKFFQLSIRALVAKICPTKLCDGAQMAIFGEFLRPVFSASSMQHVSGLHLKLSLRPHHVCKCGIHPICDGGD